MQQYWLAFFVLCVIPQSLVRDYPYELCLFGMSLRDHPWMLSSFDAGGGGGGREEEKETPPAGGRQGPRFLTWGLESGKGRLAWTPGWLPPVRLACVAKREQRQLGAFYFLLLVHTLFSFGLFSFGFSAFSCVSQGLFCLEVASVLRVKGLQCSQ
ncbi:hypothetical protein QBC34DRAFT_73226 [Podospora aff. communis PSN243]|uniref:Secreted protein n=1 Tax=Podospora aff. communis PSN243 TaxID=3040156 RepID=A0AAV9H4W0_9PEZI|nr:hypothetical protein QBC34DRAFT_73226 [Podospora aff. communis PSN243]